MPVLRTIDGDECRSFSEDARLVEHYERSIFSHLLGVKSDAATLIEMAHEVAKDGQRLRLDSETKALISDTMGALMDVISETANIGGRL